MWHVPQIFHRFSVRLSDKFLKIECHHGTKLIKNMNSIVRWGWVWYKKLCRTDRLVLFGLGFIPEVVVFDCLVGIKCVKYCKLFPYRQLSASSPFRELTRDFSGQKLTKWVRIVVFFFLWKSISRLRLLILCNASRSEGTSLWVNVWTNE